MDNKNYISTHWVETEIGEQLKFAVPPSEENINDSVNVVEEIRDEISIYFSEMIKLSGSEYEKSIMREIYDSVLDIFYEFRK